VRANLLGVMDFDLFVCIFLVFGHYGIYMSEYLEIGEVEAR